MTTVRMPGRMAGQEELGNGGLSGYAVDDHGDAGRNDGGQAGGRGDDAQRHALAMALREGLVDDLAEGGGRGRTGTGDGAENRIGNDTGDGQAAADALQSLDTYIDQPGAQAAGGDQAAGDHEEGHGQQGILGHGLKEAGKYIGQGHVVDKDLQVDRRAEDGDVDGTLQQGQSNQNDQDRKQNLKHCHGRSPLIAKHQYHPDNQGDDDTNHSDRIQDAFGHLQHIGDLVALEGFHHNVQAMVAQHDHNHAGDNSADVVENALTGLALDPKINGGDTQLVAGALQIGNGQIDHEHDAVAAQLLRPGKAFSGKADDGVEGGQGGSHGNQQRRNRKQKRTDIARNFNTHLHNLFSF